MPSTALTRPDAVHRDAYVDPSVFALEQERIFRRTWLYVAHESEVPRPGDFVLRRLGPDEVILVRVASGGLALLHNRCAHRGARIVSEPSGACASFICPYHAWSYTLEGALSAVPLEEGYGPAFTDRKRALGLAAVPRVESYRGFVFASHAASGPTLAEHLGGIASAIDNLVDRAPGGSVTQRGGRLQMEYRGNWKLFMENATDLVHPGYVHASSVGAVRQEPEVELDPVTAQARQMLASNGIRPAEWDGVGLQVLPGGHVSMGGFYRSGVIAVERADPVFERYRAALVERHGEERTHEILAVDRFNNLIWPNVSMNARFAVLRLLSPITVDRTIVTSYAFQFDGAPEEMFELSLRFLNTASSPASLVASDDLEIFERCQRGLEDSASEWIHLGRGLAHETDRTDGLLTVPGTSELNIRHQLAMWQRMMSDEAGR